MAYVLYIAYDSAFFTMTKGRFPYKLLSKYPHLMPNDIRIWERFIQTFPKFYTSIDYDVKVGTPKQYPGLTGDKYKKDLEDLSRKRIDVIGYRDKEIHIIELKPYAGFSAIGQVEGYLELYKPYLPPEEILVGFIITDYQTPDTANLCFKKGLLYINLWGNLLDTKPLTISP